MGKGAGMSVSVGFHRGKNLRIFGAQVHWWRDARYVGLEIGFWFSVSLEVSF